MMASQAKQERGDSVRGDMFEAGRKDHRMGAERAGYQ
jgi:hypothetical protein